MPAACAATRPTSHFSVLRPRRQIAWIVPITVVVCAILILALVAAYSERQRGNGGRDLTERNTVVIADFENRTGDSVFDGALKQALSVELGQSPFLSVLSDRNASETLRLMGRPSSERVTLDIARELCLRTGSKAVLSGIITSLGRHYVIDLNAIACSTGDLLGQEQSEATSKENVLRALNEVSSRLRTKLGESLPSVQKFDVPVEATTAS